MSAQPEPAKTAEIIADHYQKTYELTYELWQQRNRLFVILVTVIGVGSLLLFQAQGADTLVIAILQRLSGLEDFTLDAAQFQLLQSFLLVVVFHLMFNLHHRAVTVLRNYQYLGQVEGDIRAHLSLSKPEVAFTREGEYYWSSRTIGQKAAKWVYILLLGAGLIIFLVGRLVIDISRGNAFLTAFEVALALATLFYFVAYAQSSLGLDRRDTDRKPGVARDTTGVT